MTGDLPDVNVLWESCPSGQVVFVNEFHQSLGCSVDHGVGDHSGLTQGSSQSQAREDVPAATTFYTGSVLYSVNILGFSKGRFHLISIDMNPSRSKIVKYDVWTVSYLH